MIKKGIWLHLLALELGTLHLGVVHQHHDMSATLSGDVPWHGNHVPISSSLSVYSSHDELQPQRKRIRHNKTTISQFTNLP